MANTIDEVSNHQLFKTPSRFEKEFKEWNEDNPKVSKERYERLLPLAQLVFENIRKSEVAQIPNFALHEGYPNLNEARGQFSQYISNGNEAHLNEVINRLGLVLKSFPSRYRSNAKAIYSSVISAANFWDIIVFASMICGLAILIGPSLITYARDGFSELDWTQILSRIPISAVVFAPAGYAGAQARRQKKILDNSKQRQLQLEALGPYLSKLPKQSQEHIRAILTPRFFSSNQDEKFTIEELKSVLLSETKNENEE